MSTTKKARDPHDRYFTPDPLAEACVARLEARGLLRGPNRYAVEPAVGGGAFVGPLVKRVLAGYAYDPYVPEGYPTIGKGTVAAHWTHERRAWDAAFAAEDARIAREHRATRLIITNPPFNGQEAFVAATLDNMNPGDVAAFLLRYTFFGNPRLDLLTRHVPTGIVPIVPRMNFATVDEAHWADFADLDLFKADAAVLPGRGSDNSEYCLLVWDFSVGAKQFIEAPIVWRASRGAAGGEEEA